MFHVKTPAGLEPIECDRVIARLGATPPRKLVESFGIKFPNNDPAAVPELSATYESNVPGLYIVGALGGYPLIKQAMNQGYEVVETILGSKVVPADEDLLFAKFKGFAPSVSDALARIRSSGAAAGRHHDAAAARVHARQRRAHAGRGRGRLRAQRLHDHVLLDRRTARSPSSCRSSTTTGESETRDDRACGRASSSARWA